MVHVNLAVPPIYQQKITIPFFLAILPRIIRRKMFDLGYTEKIFSYVFKWCCKLCEVGTSMERFFGMQYAYRYTIISPVFTNPNFNFTTRLKKLAKTFSTVKLAPENCASAPPPLSHRFNTYLFISHSQKYRQTQCGSSTATQE